MYIVFILQCQRAQKLTTAKLSKKSINTRRSNLFFFFVSSVKFTLILLPILQSLSMNQVPEKL